MTAPTTRWDPLRCLSRDGTGIRDKKYVLNGWCACPQANDPDRRTATRHAAHRQHQPRQLYDDHPYNATMAPGLASFFFKALHDRHPSLDRLELEPGSVRNLHHLVRTPFADLRRRGVWGEGGHWRRDPLPPPLPGSFMLGRAGRAGARLISGTQARRGRVTRARGRERCADLTR